MCGCCSVVHDFMHCLCDVQLTACCPKPIIEIITHFKLIQVMLHVLKPIAESKH